MLGIIEYWVVPQEEALRRVPELPTYPPKALSQPEAAVGMGSPDVRIVAPWPRVVAPWPRALRPGPSLHKASVQETLGWISMSSLDGLN